MTTVSAIRNDEEIQRDVLEELKWDSRVRPNEIGVAVKDGIVTLTGFADQPAYSQRVLRPEMGRRGASRNVSNRNRAHE